MSDTPAEVRNLIVGALRRGPMYEGALRLVVRENGFYRQLRVLEDKEGVLRLVVRENGFYRQLRVLEDKGIIERDPGDPQAWRIA